MSECTHNTYRSYPYAQINAAWQALGEICYIGRRVVSCEECGADLSGYQIHRVLKVDDYIKQEA
jgi:hypothetical protein